MCRGGFWNSTQAIGRKPRNPTVFAHGQRTGSFQVRERRANHRTVITCRADGLNNFADFLIYSFTALLPGELFFGQSESLAAGGTQRENHQKQAGQQLGGWCRFEVHLVHSIAQVERGKARMD